MNKIVLSAITASILGSMLQAGGDIKPVEEADIAIVAAPNTLADAFKNGTVSGQIRGGYINFSPAIDEDPATSATALGGQLKFETAKFYGFDFGVAFYTSHAINELSGDKDEDEFNYELGSENGHYDLLAEAYLDYSYADFKIRGGRQLIDTPYADSDDIRMTPNTFEGVVATYGISDFTLIGAYLTRWQGPDAEVYDFVDLLENPDANGVAMAAATYATDNIEAGLWYYGADKTIDIIYADATATYEITEGVELAGALQYANQSEKDNSGLGGTLWGAMAEVGFSGVTLGIAYDTLDIDEGKTYFGGFGGGVAFVNMDETTAGAQAASQGIDAWKAMAGYDFSDIGAKGLAFEYHYGSFIGDNYGKIIEQNLILAYAPSDEWDIELVYANIEDKDLDIEFDENDNPMDVGFNRLLVRLSCNF